MEVSVRADEVIRDDSSDDPPPFGIQLLGVAAGLRIKDQQHPAVGEGGLLGGSHQRLGDSLAALCGMDQELCDLRSPAAVRVARKCKLDGSNDRVLDLRHEQEYRPRTDSGGD